MPDTPHFSVKDVRARLRELTLKGGTISLLAQLLRGALQLGSTAILARLLFPADYGLFGLTAVVLNLLVIFQDGGLPTATIQREELSHDQVNLLFWVNAALTAALMALMALAAPALAWLYGEPLLRELLWLMTLSLGLSGLRLQHRALLKRQMRFGSIAASDLIGVTLGITAGVLSAWNHLSFWSLAIMHITNAGVATLTTWWMCDWRPTRPKRVEGAEELLGFGGNITGFNLVNYFARNADDYLIFYKSGPDVLGLYAKAYELLRLPLQYINAPLGAVAVPTLSRLAGDPDAYRATTQRFLTLISLLSIPTAAFLTLNTEGLIRLILGERWLGAAPIFLWLGMLTLIQPLSGATGWLFITQDRTEQMLRWGILGSTLAVLSFLVGLPWGAVGVAASYTLSGIFLRTPILFWYVGREGPVHARDFYAAAAPVALATAPGALAMWGLQRALPTLHFAGILAVNAVSLFLLTLVTLWLLPSGRAMLRDLLSRARDLRALLAPKNAS